MSYTTNSTGLAAMMLLTVGPAVAQTVASQSVDPIGIAPPKPAPVPGATPVPTPDAPNVALPRRTVPRAELRPKPAPTRAPTATVKPTDKPVLNPAPVSVETRPVTKPQAREPVPAPPIAPPPIAPPPIAPPPFAPPPIAPSPMAQPTPLSQDVAPPPSRDSSSTIWPWLVGLAVAVAVAAIAFALQRRRRPAPLTITHEPEASQGPAVPTVVPELAPIAPPNASPSPAPRMLDRVRTPATLTPSAGLTIGLRPLRAGLNLLSATADCEVTVTNTGTVLADAIRCDLRLLSAHAGQDDDLATAFTDPGGRPIAPAFALAPGATCTVRGMAVLPRDAIRALNAGGRPMFVPLVAVNLTCRIAGEARQVTQAFALGIERVDSAKLTPFWLDGPARMYDAVAARPHAAVER